MRKTWPSKSSTSISRAPQGRSTGYLIYDRPRRRVFLVQLVNIADVVVDPHGAGTLRILGEKDVHLAIGYGGKGLVLLLG